MAGVDNVMQNSSRSTLSAEDINNVIRVQNCNILIDENSTQGYESDNITLPVCTLIDENWSNYEYPHNNRSKSLTKNGKRHDSNSFEGVSDVNAKNESDAFQTTPTTNAETLIKTGLSSQVANAETFIKTDQSSQVANAEAWTKTEQSSRVTNAETLIKGQQSSDVNRNYIHSASFNDRAALSGRPKCKTSHPGVQIGGSKCTNTLNAVMGQRSFKLPKDVAMLSDFNKPRFVWIAIILLVLILIAFVHIWTLQADVDRLEKRLELVGSWSNDLYDQGVPWNTKDTKAQNTLHQGGVNASPATSFDAIQLFRHVRQAGKDEPKTGQSKAEEKPISDKRKKRRKKRKGRKERNVSSEPLQGKKCQTNAKKRCHAIHQLLQTELYVAYWRPQYNPSRGNCGLTEIIPDKLTTTSCRSKSIVFKGKESILALYTKYHKLQQSSKRKKKPLDLLELKQTGKFEVKTTGVYMLHLNITITDRTVKKSVGIFLNGVVLHACPPGGIRCSKTNQHDSSAHRLCIAQGIAKLQEKDEVDIRTLDSEVMIKMKLTSHFWAVLLAKHVTV